MHNANKYVNIPLVMNNPKWIMDDKYLKHLRQIVIDRIYYSKNPNGKCDKYLFSNSKVFCDCSLNYGWRSDSCSSFFCTTKMTLVIMMIMVVVVMIMVIMMMMMMMMVEKIDYILIPGQILVVICKNLQVMCQTSQSRHIDNDIELCK